jgi:hypothetical protein
MQGALLPGWFVVQSGLGPEQVNISASALCLTTDGT